MKDIDQLIEPESSASSNKHVLRFRITSNAIYEFSKDISNVHLQTKVFSYFRIFTLVSQVFLSCLSSTQILGFINTFFDAITFFPSFFQPFSTSRFVIWAAVYVIFISVIFFSIYLLYRYQTSNRPQSQLPLKSWIVIHRIIFPLFGVTLGRNSVNDTQAAIFLFFYILIIFISSHLYSHFPSTKWYDKTQTWPDFFVFDISLSIIPSLMSFISEICINRIFFGFILLTIYFLLFIFAVFTYPFVSPPSNHFFIFIVSAVAPIGFLAATKYRYFGFIAYILYLPVIYFVTRYLSDQVASKTLPFLDARMQFHSQNSDSSLQKADDFDILISAQDFITMIGLISTFFLSMICECWLSSKKPLNIPSSGVLKVLFPNLNLDYLNDPRSRSLSTFVTVISIIFVIHNHFNGTKRGRQFFWTLIISLSIRAIFGFIFPLPSPRSIHAQSLGVKWNEATFSWIVSFGLKSCGTLPPISGQTVIIWTCMRFIGVGKSLGEKAGLIFAFTITAFYMVLTKIHYILDIVLGVCVAEICWKGYDILKSKEKNSKYRIVDWLEVTENAELSPC